MSAKDTPLEVLVPLKSWEDAVTEAQVLEGELAKARTQIVDLNAYVRFLERTRDELQRRGTELVEEARAARRAERGMRLMLDIHPLAPMLVALDESRKKGNLSVDAWRDLVASVGRAADRGSDVKAACLDVAVIALRISMEAS